MIGDATADFIRAFGIATAAMAAGALLGLLIAKPTSTAFAVPWRYWIAAAGLIVEISGFYARLDLWGTPLSYRDVTFLAVNVCLLTGSLGALTHPPARRKDDRE